MAVLAAEKLPTLVVVPKISITAWTKVAKHFGEALTIVSYDQLRLGRSGLGAWTNNPPPGFTCELEYRCTNCQQIVNFLNHVPCYCHPRGIHCVDFRKKPWKYGSFNFHPGIKRIVFDEAHRCSAAGGSLNADMLTATRRHGIKTTLISATLAASPLELKAAGFVLGMHNLTDYYEWLHKHGCGKLKALPGMRWTVGKDKQEAVMKGLNEFLIPSRGVRVRTQDIPGFPSRTITADLYDIDNYGGIDALYREMEEAMRAIRSQREGYKDPEGALAKVLDTNQQLELLKVPVLVELAEDIVAKGGSVGIFIKYKRTMAELRKRLKCDCYIDGSNTATRDKNIDAFNADDERIILVNSGAGKESISLHDLHGKHARTGLLVPNVGARTFRQIVGRFHREGGLTPCFYRVVLAARTDEEKTYNKLQSTLKNIDTLNDGDFLPFNL